MMFCGVCTPVNAVEANSWLKAKTKTAVIAVKR